METTPAPSTSRDALDHPLYRMAHLHDNRWVTLRPQDQHSAREHDAGSEWSDAIMYECEECSERVVIAPA